MNIASLISQKLQQSHRGMANSITRKALLDYVQVYEPEIDDRLLRRIYSQLPVIACRKGIFWPTSPDELLRFRSYLIKKSAGLFNRWKIISKAHSAMLNESQMRLF